METSIQSQRAPASAPHQQSRTGTLTSHAGMLKQVEQRLLWLSHWMIHHANHIRPSAEGIKIGGHQASSASLVSLMTALYFSALRVSDRVAVKPHASPVFHAMQYLVGRLDVERMKQFRGLGGVQSYPSRTKDSDDVDFSTGSVGLGVAITSFASLVQDYCASKQWGGSVQKGRMVALAGDAELDEGNIYECLQEGWKHNLRDVWWIIDYNRQSLDGIIHEGLWERLEKIFDAFGWQVVRVKYGRYQREAFAEPGGDALKQWIDSCPNDEYSALAFQGGAAWRERLENDLGDQGRVSGFLASRNDDELAALMTNLGGNCVETLADTFASITHDNPVCFLAYTIKGWGTPLAGHKDNHGGLMTPQQMADWQARMGVRAGHEWDRLETVSHPERLQQFLDEVPFFQLQNRRFSDGRISVPQLELRRRDEISTQAGFGRLLDEIARSETELSQRVITTSPDVSGTTSLGPWINRKGLFSRIHKDDHFRSQNIPSTARWQFSQDGQHIELGIAEMNLFLLLAAAGLSHSLFGKRLLPIGTVYDSFIARGLDALNYACYQEARFIIVGTPSGVTLAPEGGAHQSVGTPLIGMSQDGIASFEPAFVDELTVIFSWALDYLQRESGRGAAGAAPEAGQSGWLRDDTGGSVYLRLTTRPLEQPRRQLSDAQKDDIIKGGYWLRKPGPNCELVLAFQGVIADHAIAAVAPLAEQFRDIGLLAVTSADRLNAGWTAAQRARREGVTDARSHIESLLASVGGFAKMVTVLDGHPATLGWLGSVQGHRCVSLGVEHFGQTGSVSDLYAHFGINTRAIINAALSLR